MKNDNVGTIARAIGMGVVVGAMTGFVAGLLVAPEEGTRLRRRISYHLEGVRKQLKEFMESSLGEEYDNEARRHGEELVTKVHERAQEISDNIDAVLEEVPGRGTS